MAQTITNATSLVATIEGDSEYDWANNPQNLGAMQDMLTQLHASTSQVGREFNVQSLAVMKRKYSVARLETELNTYLQLDGQVEALSRHVAKVIKRSNL